MNMVSSLLILASDDGPGAFLGGILVGFVLGMILVAYVASRRRRARAKSPKLAGSAIPELGDGIDLSKRYDITFAGDWHSGFVQHWEKVRIVGYVGSDNDETVAKMYMRGRWLVVEFADGVRGYLLPSSIVALRQAA
jgi:hypothetical protein